MDKKCCFLHKNPELLPISTLLRSEFRPLLKTSIPDENDVLTCANGISGVVKSQGPDDSESILPSRSEPCEVHIVNVVEAFRNRGGLIDVLCGLLIAIWRAVRESVVHDTRDRHP